MDGGGSPVRSTNSAFVTPLMISVAGMVATTLAIVAYHFFLVRYCVRRQADANNNGSLPCSKPTTASRSRRENPQNHTDSDFFQGKGRRPVLLRSKRMRRLPGRVGGGERHSIVAKLQARVIKHIFHLSCIDNWFSAHTSCPVCRSPVVPELDSTASTASAPPSGDDLDSQRTRNLHQGSGDGSSASGAGSIDNNNNSNALLGHCASFVLPRQHLRTELKRSLSLDQSYVLINLGGESGRMAVSCSSSGFSYKAQLKRQFDRTRKCSRLLRSLSQLRIGTASTANQILRY
ncbi:hypothetical protein SLA2020_318080 [Shorea laevis]